MTFLLKLPDFGGKFAEPGTQPVKSRVSPESKRTTATNSVSTLELQVRPDASFKIKDSLRQLSQQQPVTKVQAVVEKHENIEAREPITEEKVKAALEQYIREHAPDPTISIALTTHRSEITQEQIVIAVDNQLQLDKLEALKLHLQQALMKTLRNGFIVLKFKLFDSETAKEEKKLFTSTEKFEHFIKLNPVIADLKNIFGLELE